MAVETLEAIIELINKELKKTINEKSIVEFLNLESSLSFQSIKTHLIRPCNDMIRRGGKRIRPLLVVLCTKMMIKKHFFLHLLLKLCIQLV